MSIPLAKQNQLRAVFSSLPDSITDRLYETFKGARNSGDTSLPFDVLLSLFPNQISEPEIRELFYPVSELIVLSATRADQVSFELLRNIWEMYISGDGSKLASSWQDDVTSLRRCQTGISEMLRGLWEKEGGVEELSSRFGEENVSRIRLIFTVMAFAEEIGEMISNLPDRIKDLGDQYLLPLRDLNDLLAENEPDITPFLLFFLKTRLRHPQQILRAIERLSRQNSDLMIINTDMNVIVEVLLDEADALLASAGGEITEMEQVEQIVKDLARFGNIIAGSIEEFDISSDSSWGKRLYGISNRAVQFWTRRANQAWKIIDRALPRARLKSFLGGSLTGADISVELDVDLVKEAILSTHLLNSIFIYASRIGFSAARDSVTTAIDERLREQENNLIAMLADPGESDVEQLQSHFTVLVKITQAFHGDEAASILSRRGASATSSSA
ncbi:MAG: hypothetical protein JKY46_05120 [Robiginitomaculum sp.]|nr:hypothetical protein [Robiginitomaculum sp.]